MPEQALSLLRQKAVADAKAIEAAKPPLERHKAAANRAERARKGVQKEEAKVATLEATLEGCR